MCAVIVFVLSCLVCVSGVSLVGNAGNRTLIKYDTTDVLDNNLLMLHELRSNESLATSLLRNGRQNTNSSSSSNNRRCVCELGVCKCCTGLVMDLLNQKACLRITYQPGEFAFDVAMSLNNRILYENSMSGKNPKPICITPPRINNLKMCAKFYNVFFPGRNFHFCLTMTGRWRSLDLYEINFDCLRMGANGIVTMKPEENGGLPILNPLGTVDAVVDSGDDDIEDYDENVVKSLLGDLFER